MDGKKIVGICILLSVFIISLAIFLMLQKNNSGIAVKMDVVAIEKDEFEFFLNRNRSNTILHIEKNYNIMFDNEFWDKDMDGKNLKEYLYENTFADLRKVKTIEKLAKMYGVEVENFGQDIFGMDKFDDNQRFNYYISKLSLALQNHLTENVFDITSNEVREFYEEVKETNYKKSPRITCEAIYFSVFDKSEYEIENWKTNIEEVVMDDNFILNGEGDLFFSREDSENMIRDLTSIGAVGSETTFFYNGYCIILEPKEIMEQGFFPFEEVEKSVTLMYLEKTYHEKIASEAEKAKMLVDWSIIKSIHIE